MAEYQPPPPRSELLWVGVDLDGTLAEPVWTPSNPTAEIGEPIWPNVYKLRALKAAGYKIHIHTSRPWTDYEAIEHWLIHWNVGWEKDRDAIQCGKPLYALYIDDRGRHADAPSWLPGATEEEQSEVFAAEREALAKAIHRKVNSSRIGASVPYLVGDAERAVAAVIQEGWVPGT